MKKKVFIIGVILILICFVFPKEKENVRVRVVANSDSYTDQLYKTEVVKIMKKIIKCDDSYQDVLGKMKELEDAIEVYEKQKGLEITVEFIKTKFPTKTLNGEIIQGGIYDTLLITIGEGKGKNYWSLLYPEYYGFTFEDVDSDNIEVKFYIWEKFKMIFN